MLNMSTYGISFFWPFVIDVVVLLPRLTHATKSIVQQPKEHLNSNCGKAKTKISNVPGKKIKNTKTKTTLETPMQFAVMRFCHFLDSFPAQHPSDARNAVFPLRPCVAFCAQDMHKQHEMALAITTTAIMCVAFRNSVAAKKEKLIRLIISNGDGLFCNSLFEGVPVVVRVCVCVWLGIHMHIGCCIKRRKRRRTQEIASDRIHLRQCAAKLPHATATRSQLRPHLRLMPVAAVRLFGGATHYVWHIYGGTFVRLSAYRPRATPWVPPAAANAACKRVIKFLCVFRFVLHQRQAALPGSSNSNGHSRACVLGSNLGWVAVQLCLCPF